MASAFSITTTTNAISLDASRQAVAVFTVNNQTGRSVRVRTDVAAFPPTPPDWFSIEGAVERLYPPGGAEAVTVHVQATALAPAGAYAFRLDALSVDRPDEEWAHGPSVGFEIAPPPEPQEPQPEPVRRGYLETVIGTLAGTVVAIVLSVVISAIVVAFAFGSTFPGVAAILFRLSLLDGVTLGCALAAGLGAVVALGFRGIADPDPWRTGLAVGVLALVVLTILEAGMAKAFPFAPVDPASFFVSLILTLILVVPVALAGRAYARLRAGGKL